MHQDHLQLNHRPRLMLLLTVLLVFSVLTTAAAEGPPRVASLGVEVDDPSLNYLSQKITESLANALAGIEGYDAVSYSELLQAASKEGLEYSELDGKGAQPVLQQLNVDYYIEGRVFQGSDGRVLTLRLYSAKSLKLEREVSVPYVGTISSILTVKLRDGLLQLLK